VMTVVGNRRSGLRCRGIARVDGAGHGCELAFDLRRR
jgi:hypothetical protein